jgi:hypothetical protein
VQYGNLPDAEYTSAEELAHPTGKWATMKDGRQRYSTSKLCNVLWAYALDRRLEKSSSDAQKSPPKKITVTAMDPGLMPGTGLAREYTAFQRFFWLHILPLFIPLARKFVHPNVHTAAESGASLAKLAMNPEFEGVSGKYFEGVKEIKSSEVSYDVSKQEELWAWTVKTLAVGDDEKAKFEAGY